MNSASRQKSPCGLHCHGNGNGFGFVVDVDVSADAFADADVSSAVQQQEVKSLKTRPCNYSLLRDLFLLFSLLVMGNKIDHVGHQLPTPHTPRRVPLQQYMSAWIFGCVCVCACIQMSVIKSNVDSV